MKPDRMLRWKNMKIVDANIILRYLLNDNKILGYDVCTFDKKLNKLFKN